MRRRIRCCSNSAEVCIRDRDMIGVTFLTPAPVQKSDSAAAALEFIKNLHSSCLFTLRKLEGYVYFASLAKRTAGAILPFAKRGWLK